MQRHLQQLWLKKASGEGGQGAEDEDAQHAGSQYGLPPSLVVSSHRRAGMGREHKRQHAQRCLHARLQWCSCIHVRVIARMQAYCPAL